MRQLSSWALLLIATLALIPIQSFTQESASQRKLLDHAAPGYPALARSMALQGIVKVDVLVAPNGKVKSTEVRGGHPVLAQAAVNAVRNWRWESNTHESHELVQVSFSPVN